MDAQSLSAGALDVVAGGAIDFNWDPNRRETIDLVQRRRDLDNDYWGFADAVRNGREAMQNIDDNNGLIDRDSTPDYRREVEDANQGWQQQLDTARERIDESNQLQEQYGREPWSEDMVPTPDYESESEYYNYENLGGTEDNPIYGA
jgi:hypothetical protein